jgi:ParB-like chromosome segregation protein Spo0J
MEAEDRQTTVHAEGPLLADAGGQESESSGAAHDAPAFVPSHPAPELIPLDRVDEAPLFQIRPLGDMSLLATDLARLGQLFPIDVRAKGPDRYQVICGYRRVAALKFLQRDEVLARVHANLSDDDALLMSLAAAIHGAPTSREELERFRGILEQEGRLSSRAVQMLDKALAPDSGLAPESVEEEVEADELAADAAARLGEINQDLALLAEVFASLDPTLKEELLRQLRYSAELVAYLEGL